MDFSNNTFKKTITKKKLSYDDCYELIGRLFQSRNIAHLAHLNTMSFAEHKALDAYYSTLLDLTDSLAEKYFGIYGRQPITIESVTTGTDMKTHLKELRQEIVEHREYVKETNIQNIIDELLSLIDETSYLLTLK